MTVLMLWARRWNARRRARNLLDDAAALRRKAHAMRRTPGLWQGYWLVAEAVRKEQEARRLLGGP